MTKYIPTRIHLALLTLLFGPIFLLSQGLETHTFNNGGGHIAILSDRTIVWSVGESQVGSFQGSDLTYQFGFQAMIEDQSTTATTIQNPILGTIVYPKPVHDILHVEWTLANQEHLALGILSLSGKIISMQSLSRFPAGHHQRQIDVEYLLPGSYAIFFRNAAGIPINLVKFIKI